MKMRSIIALWLFVIACTSKKAEITGREGEPMPVIELLLPDSVTHITMISQSKKKPIVLMNFSPQCRYSRDQIKEIIDHMDEVKLIQFYLICSTSFEEMKSFYTELQLKHYPNIEVGIDVNNSFQRFFTVPGYPYMAIYGANGKLTNVYLGLVSYKQIVRTAIKESNS
jgi:hypothetical protein